MNSKRSYLDTLNAGRQRRPHTTLDQLNRSLEELEQRIGRSRDEAPRQAPRQTQSARTIFEEERLRQRQPAANSSYPDSAYHSLAHDIDRVRAQENGVAEFGKIASELKGLREELRNQLTSGVKREFDTLRQEMARAYSGGVSMQDCSELGAEFERLSGAIANLSERSDDKSIGLLRLEVEQVRNALSTLAREETLRSVDQRWDDFDRRWTDFESRVTAPAGHTSDPAIEALTDRLEQISAAVNNLPESLSLRTLEDKLRTLSGAVDHFVGQQANRGSDTFALIEERLDEISRAILASSVAAQIPNFDPEPFQRIEARIGALALQIEEVADRQAPQAFDAEPIFRGIEQRFDILSDVIERRQGDAMEQSGVLFRDLERRLDDVADRLDRQNAEKSFDNSGIMDAIDARFAALATRLDAHGKEETSGAIKALETRLEEISARIDNSASQFSGIDSSLIKSLESQVAGLSAHLSQPGAPLPEFEDISPRLSDIEKSISESRDSILEAARSAAENAVRSMNLPAHDGVLAEDLKALETLTRRSDERNAKTFEAIHDTLLKIVDRLGSLETKEPELPALAFVNRETASMVSVERVPSLDLEDALPLPEKMLSAAQEERPVRTPAEAAAAAAMAAIDSDDAEEQAEHRKAKSLFGGLARAFASRKAEPKPRRTEPEAAPSISEAAPSLDLDEPLNAKSANRPLEPGSGAPDLNAILRRVRDERGQTNRAAETDAGKSDFIAAARRAAQAAAAEAEVLKQQSGVKGPVRALRIGDILKKRRKTVLMATTAVALGIAGLQLGSAFMSEPAQNVQAGDQVPDTSMDLSAAPETMNDAPEVQASSAAPALESSIETAAIQPELDTPDIPVQPAAPAVENVQAQTPIVVPANAGPEPLREAAQAGDAKAMFEVATNYAEGRGMNANMAEAAKWYEQAAELGFAPAQYRIGNLYEKGLGVERDIPKSKTWYQLAANQGNASAMHNLAVLFAMGADGTTDNDSATRWFVEAADLGVKDSQFNLGILAAKGVGMPQNLEEAYKWFGLVAKTGDKDASAKRDEIATSLRPEQLERARASVELWKAKPLNAEANTVEIPESWQSIDPTPTAGIDMKKAMQNIQTYLNQNGYDAGKPDGLAGQKTKAAIAQFQKDNDMPATGEIDEKFVRALIARK